MRREPWYLAHTICCHYGEQKYRAVSYKSFLDGLLRPMVHQVGLGKIAKQAGMSKRGLRRALGPGFQIGFVEFHRVTKALGLELGFERLDAHEKRETSDVE